MNNLPLNKSSSGPQSATPIPSIEHPLDRYAPPTQSSEGGDKSPYYKPSAPSISLPKGGGAIKGIDEKFSVNAVNGTAALDIPLPLTPGRGGFTPALSLSYNSGGGASEAGLGWALGLPSISRRTDRRLPRYDDDGDSDTFLLAGVEDLVPKLKEVGSSWDEDESIAGGYLIRRYRPRIEGLFARIEHIRKLNGGASWWRVTTKDNITTYYGLTAAARLADPSDAARIARWLPQLVVDGKGNAQVYEYLPEDLRNVPNTLHEAARHSGLAPFTNLYLKRIKWCNLSPFAISEAEAYEPEMPSQGAIFLMQAVLDYGDHPDAIPAYDAHSNGAPCRKDPFSDYRYGFEVRTYRQLRRVLMFHCFKELNNGANYTPQLVRSLTLTYALDNGPQDALVEADFITSALQTGYKRGPGGDIRTESLPPMTFDYQPLQWSSEVKNVEDEDWQGAPQGLSGPYQWIDLWGEGLPGILHEDAAGGWHYKQNKGDRHFSPAATVAEKPSFAGLGAGLQWQDLDADGRRQLVSYEAEYPGYFEMNDEGRWQGFTPFRSRAQVDWSSPYTKLLDLDGDGRPDLLLTNDGVWTWFKNKGTEGFSEGGRVSTVYDEEKGPRLVFADAVQQVFLADMSGDGLTDLVRIRNGEVCYWPNLGWGRFGGKVSMSNAPVFATPDLFNPRYLQFADISGTGAADLVYLADGTFRIWINQSGNGWSAPQELAALPEVAPENSVAVLDFLGNGTGCIVWSSPLPQHARSPLRYVDLMGGTKPYILKSYANGMGKSVALSYRSSTHYYLADKTAGTPWATKLPFPVQCLRQVTTADAVSETTYTQHYTYHHGYYDNAEREFRGFGRVDVVDTDSATAFVTGTAIAADLDQAPVLTKTWYHTGAWMREGTLLDAFEEEYYSVPGSAGIKPTVGASLPTGLSALEEREAYRALKGSPLRQEVYALDGTLKEDIPYTIAAHTYRTKLVQPSSQWEDERRPASFFTHAEEALTWSCERDPSDARLAQELTLEVDAYGNVTRSAQVAYPRTAAGLATLVGLPVVEAAQEKMHITASHTSFTTDVLTSSLHYRLRLPYEARSYELRGFAVPAGRWTASGLKVVLDAATVVDHSDTTTPGLCKRTLSHTRTLFRPDNGTATPLVAGTLEPLALPYEQYTLSFTPDVLGASYGGRVDASMLAEGGYKNLNGDGQWWVPSGVAHFDAGTATSFYTPTRYTDPWGASSAIDYWGDYWLLPKSTTDALGNATKIEQYDWRSLQAEIIIDPNENISEAIYSPLGLPVAMALKGKGSEGDLLEDFDNKPLDPNSPDDDELRDLFLSKPLEYAHSLLGKATWRCVYDLSAAPTVVAMIAREQHWADNQRSPALIRFTYTDGFGRVAMHKAQAANESEWIGSGKTVYNNKGAAVLQYEPYFSPTHKYDPALQAAESGVSPRIHYDPLGRAWKTEAPDGTFSYTAWDGWKQEVWDASDTVLQSVWYARRTGSGPLASNPDEADAVAKALEHAATPTVMHLDSLGRPFYTIQHDRYPDANGWHDAFYHSHEVLDIAGTRLAVHDALGRVPLQYCYNLLGAPCWQESIDGGAAYMLVDAAGQPLYGWDADDRCTRIRYDLLRRPFAKLVKDAGSQTEVGLEGKEYGEGQAADTVRNLRGQLYQSWDGAGKLQIDHYDFKGTPVETVQQLLADATLADANWNGSPPALDATLFSKTLKTDALGRPTQTTDPGGNITYHYYDRGGALRRVELQKSGAGTPDVYVKDIHYDAKGQRQAIWYGNNTKTSYFYDPLTYRLRRLLTVALSSNEKLQDLHYFYDPSGNITRIRDEAGQTFYTDNTQIEPLQDYTYDALYRLVVAAGRERTSAALASVAQDDNWSNSGHMGNAYKGSYGDIQAYTQRYTYDAVGNIDTLQHIAAVGGYTRNYGYTAGTNRLAETIIGTDSYTYTHDARGNIVKMPHLSAMSYNRGNEMSSVANGSSMQAYYQYSGGERTRKWVIKGAVTEERIYLGGWERYRRYTGGVLDVERTTVHVTDDAGRVAMLEIRSPGYTDAAAAELARYVYSNHLGSATLELDSAGEVISYEEYHPYGTSAYQATNAGIKAVAKRYRYTGKERDEESGLNYHSARYYVPWLGRWCAVDPILFEWYNYKTGAPERAKGRQCLELVASGYEYCYDNPILFVDHAGEQPQADNLRVYRRLPDDQPKQKPKRPNGIGIAHWNWLLNKSSKSIGTFGSDDDLTSLDGIKQFFDSRIQKWAQKLASISGGTYTEYGKGVKERWGYDATVTIDRSSAIFYQLKHNLLERGFDVGDRNSFEIKFFNGINYSFLFPAERPSQYYAQPAQAVPFPVTGRPGIVPNSGTDSIARSISLKSLEELIALTLLNSSSEVTDEDEDRDWRQDKKLSKQEIEALQEAGFDVHGLKGEKSVSRQDLYKDRKGNIYVKPKDGHVPGEPLGININNY